MDVKIQHQQGQAIMNFLGSQVRMPAQLGNGDDAEKFDDIERSFLDEQIGKIRKLLMSYSLRKPETKEILFGKPENWKPTLDTRTGRKNHDMIDEEASFPMKLDDDEREGLYWTLLLMSHPSSPTAQPIAVLEEVVWPVAREIGADKQLAKHLKIDKRKSRALLWNDNKEWNRKESKQLTLVEKPAAPEEKKAEA